MIISFPVNVNDTTLFIDVLLKLDAVVMHSLRLDGNSGADLQRERAWWVGTRGMPARKWKTVDGYY